MTKGFNAAFDALNSEQREFVKKLMADWGIKKSDALPLYLKRESLEAVLLKYGRTPVGRVIPIAPKRNHLDALTRRLPGSFESQQR